jgi:hypothetical protein
MVFSENEAKPPSQFQLFVLAYLTSEERKKIEQQQLLDDTSFVHHSESTVLPHSVKVTIDELSSIVPHSIIPAGLNAAHSEFQELCVLGLLEVDNMRARFLPQHAAYSITTDGKFTINKFFIDLVEAARNRTIYDRVVEEQEASQELKNKFNGLWDRLKDKSQDERVKIVFTTIKEVGPPVIAFMIRVYLEYTKHTT